MKVKIGENSFEAHFSLRAQMIWEQHYGKKFNPVTIEEVFCYYYFVIYACNPDLNGDEFTFESFLQAIEQDASIVNQLVEAITIKKKSLLKRMKFAWRILMG